jgi:hypothetical protein
MVDDGIAVALMGNHELNAIAFSTRANDGTLDARRAHADACEALRTGRPSRGWQRPHEQAIAEPRAGRRTLINLQHHRATLVSTEPAQYAEMIEWFLRLPLWLEMPDLRAVHAAWVPSAIETIRAWARSTRRRNPGLDATEMTDDRRGPICFESAAEECRRRSSIKPEERHQRAMLLLIDAGLPAEPSPLALAVEQILKGPELPLRTPLSDPEGTPRRSFRVRWFDPFQGQTVREYWMGPQHALAMSTPGLLDDAACAERESILATRVTAEDASRLAEDVRRGYGADERPVFFGHYGLRAGEIPRIGANWACLDHAAFHADGALAAYRLERDAAEGLPANAGRFTPLRGDRVCSESWFEREHRDHGRPVDVADEPPLGARARTPAEFTLTLLNCDSDALHAEGRRRAADLAKVDRETAVLLGIPRVWPDTLPAWFGRATAPDPTCANEGAPTELSPLDPDTVARIRRHPSPSQPIGPATEDALRQRVQRGLPVPEQ